MCHRQETVRTLYAAGGNCVITTNAIEWLNNVIAKNNQKSELTIVFKNKYLLKNQQPMTKPLRQNLFTGP